MCFCCKNRCAVYCIPIHEVLVVKVHEYLRPNGVFCCLLTITADQEVLAATVGFNGVVAGNGIENEAATLVAVADILGYDYRSGEPTVNNAVRTVVQFFVPNLVDKRFITCVATCGQCALDIIKAEEDQAKSTRTFS